MALVHLIRKEKFQSKIVATQFEESDNYGLVFDSEPLISVVIGRYELEALHNQITNLLAE